MWKTVKTGILPPFKVFFALSAGLFFLAPRPAAAAEITVPRLELASRGWFENDEFTVSSRLSMDLALIGGYKYSILLGFSLEAPDVARAIAYRSFKASPVEPDPVTGQPNPEDLMNSHNSLVEKYNNQAFIGFSVAKATIHNPFKLPLSLSYFVGSGDNFCTGDDFSVFFGLDPFGTDYKGFFYFPDGIGGNMLRQYNGIHGAKGTGFSIAFTKWDSFIIPMLYLYQDLALFDGYFADVNSGSKLYSGDLRLLVHWRWLSFETFGGFSTNSSKDTKFRAGLMFHFAGKGVEFFAQGGITSWRLGEKLNVDNMFFLIEPRLRFKYLAVHVTFFYHPVEYLHIEEQKEQGMADFNVKFMFGTEDSGFSAGFETAVELKINDSDHFKFRISPFGSFAAGGLLWETKLRLMPQNFSKPKEMMELFLGVRTAY